MPDTPKPKPNAPDLPPVDPAALEHAVRRAVETKKPPSGWNRGAKKKPADGG